MLAHESTLAHDMAGGGAPFARLPLMEEVGPTEWALAVAKLDGVERTRRMRILSTAFGCILDDFRVVRR